MGVVAPGEKKIFVITENIMKRPVCLFNFTGQRHLYWTDRQTYQKTVHANVYKPLKYFACTGVLEISF